MFNKLKHLKELRQQAKTIQNALEKETVSIEKNGIKVVINGNLEIKEIILNPEMPLKDSEKILVDCFNEAIKKTQKIMAGKMQEMGGLPNLM